MKSNTLGALNNHLFEQMERLNDDEYMAEHGETEIERSKSIIGVGKTIIENGRLLLDAQKHVDGYRPGSSEMPALLSVDDDE